MTYQTAQITPARYSAIKKLPIPNQKQVIQETGQPFEPIKTLQAIRQKSKDYTVEHPTAKQVDRMMVNWLRQGGFPIGDSTPTSSANNAKEAEKQDYIEAIEALEALLILSDDDEKEEIEDAITALYAMIDLL